jgi:outer membrane receptor protein involved in Fe transport
MLIAVALAVTFAAAAPSPSPSPSASPLQSIGETRAATGTRGALHRSPITATALDVGDANRSGETFDAQLRALPGYDRTRANTGFSNYGLDRLSIEGAGTDRAAFVVDGVPATDPFGGQIDWSAVPGDVLTRVELFTGPGSALYGSGAIGGALVAHTYDARDAAAGLTATQVTAQIGGDASSGSIVGGGRSGRLAWAAWGQTGRAEFGALPPVDTSFNSGAAATVMASGRATVRYAVGAFAIEAGTTLASDAQQEGRPEYGFARDQRQADLAINAGGGATSYALNLFARTTALINTSDTFPSAPGTPLYTQTVLANDIGASFQLLTADAYGSTLLLVGTRDGGGNTLQRSGVGALQSNAVGVQRDAYAALQREIVDGRFDLIVGARLDAFTTAASLAGTSSADRSDNAVSPRFAASYAIGKPVVVRLYDGGGLREPFLNELVRSYRIGTITYASNIDLVPERSRGDGVGIDVVAGATRATFDLQQTRVADAIDFRTISSTLQMRSNVGATATDGAQFSLVRTLHCGRLDVTASERYARITADVDPSLLGQRLPYVPDRSVSIGWSGGGATVAAVRVTALGTAYADDRNVMLLPAATVVDASLTRPGPRVDITIGATNATDARYLSSPDRLAPPSNLYLRLTTHAPPPMSC